VVKVRGISKECLADKTRRFFQTLESKSLRVKTKPIAASVAAEKLY
jgi:hypothetical protein